MKKAVEAEMCFGGGFVEWGCPQIIYFNGILHYKPSIFLDTPNLGIPHMSHSFKYRMFHEINHPAIGDPPHMKILNILINIGLLL